MKNRMGFVSNSSSSSFIIGIGVVTDRKKFNDWMGTFPENIIEDIQVVNPEIKSEEPWSALNKASGYYVVKAPVNDYCEVSLKVEKYEELQTNVSEDVAVICLGNNEGDGAFLDDEHSDWVELNYNIDLDWFSEDQQRLYNEFNASNGISLIDLDYGAARNG